MSLSEDALIGLNTIGSHPKPFSPESLRSHRQVKGYREYLNEGITEDPIPSKEGMAVILMRIKLDKLAREKREQSGAAFQGDQADTACQEHGETE